MSRQSNDTDQMMALVDLLEKENALLGKLDDVFRQTAERMQAVLTRAQTT